jgi:N5-(cytidine 5'-diphosphoramidyl)-L-glutamine hydrolase
MRIVITQRVVENDSYIERRDTLAHDWYRFFNSLKLNIVLMPMPNFHKNVKYWLETINPHAIVLSNGNDWGTCPERDQTERIVFKYAVKRRLPVLGVCRGLHTINSILGGQICKSVSKEFRYKCHIGNTHDVKLTTNDFIECDESSIIEVNSFHDQGFGQAEMCSDLRCFALSFDGLVEGAYHKSAPVMGIQWHPERNSPNNKYNKFIIKKFLSEGAFWV